MRNAITIAFQNNLMHHSFCEKHSKLSLHFFWVRSDTINYKKISPIVHIASKFTK
ncbi:hypothetical protein [Wolbachia endosymbiont (group A) of Sphecodes monilicornis]|uniref:hypothetical protein n=1 Tax=Wolbachia endosymbiont (group A) of Sphecodes monilicornis TaxID=2954060 RepID=UPI002225BC88|nr:hypothetical protein [Wolbachia endosymbiont (group A) of Sphecodes monilicornis]